MATVNEKMTAIANNIRDKTGGTEALTLDDMASGVNEVYEAGKFAEKDKFWEDALKNGVSAMSFSGNAWNDDTFQPTRNIWCQNGNNGNWFFSDNKITSVKKALAIHNVNFDTKNLTGLSYAFNNLITTDLPELDFSKVKDTKRFDNGFKNNANLITVDKIMLTENWTSISSFGNFMAGNSKLENVIFEGVIPATISFSSSPLSVESIKNIITHLKDYSGTDNEYTITFNGVAFCALGEEEIEWVRIIISKKWNLVMA